MKQKQKKKLPKWIKEEVERSNRRHAKRRLPKLPKFSFPKIPKAKPESITQLRRELKAATTRAETEAKALAAIRGRLDEIETHLALAEFTCYRRPETKYLGEIIEKLS